MSSVFKKWISIALAIVLVLSYVPLGAAFAEVEEPVRYGTHTWPKGGDKDNSHFVIQGIEMKSAEGKIIDLGAEELPTGEYTIKFDVFLDTSVKEIHFPSVEAYVNSELVVNNLQLHKSVIPGFKEKVSGTVYATYDIKEGTNIINLRASGQRALSIGDYGWNHCKVDLTFKGVEYVTVTFEAYGENGEVLSKISSKVKKGETAEAPEDPSLEGYKFIGWFDSNGAEFDSETPVSEDITWTAKFTPNEYAVSFDLKGGKLDVEFDDVIGIKHGKTVKEYCGAYDKGDLYNALVKGPSKDSDEQYNYKFKGWVAEKPIMARSLSVPASDSTGEDEEFVNLDTYCVVKDVNLVAKWAQEPIVPSDYSDVQTEAAKFYFATIMDDKINDSDYVTNVEAFYPLNGENKTQLVGGIKGTKTDLEAIKYGEPHLTGTALENYTYVRGGKKLSFASSKDDFLAAFDSIKNQEIEFKQGENTVKLKLSDPGVGIRLMRVSRQKTLDGQGIDGEYVVHVDLRITRAEAEDISVSYYLDGKKIGEFDNQEDILSQTELDSLEGESKSGKFGTQYNIPIPALKAFKLDKVTKDDADLSKNDEGNYAVSFDSESHEIKVYFVSKQKYTVNFDLNEGKMRQENLQIASQEVYEGGKAVKPDTDPVREGHTFGGWFEKKEGQLKDNQFDFENTLINSNITLYAKWTPVENGGGNPGENPGGDNPGSDNPGDNPGGEENPGGGTPEEGTTGDGTPEDGKPDNGTPEDGKPDNGTPEDGTPDGTPEDDTVEVEEEETPLGTNEDENKDSNENKDPNKDETVEIDAEETPLGTSEEKTNEDATKETSEVETLLTLEEEETPLGTAEPNPDSEQVVNLDFEEAVPLGTSLPYTGQSSDVPVSVIGGLIVALGIALKKISRR